ncbi:MAG: hypothetical protein ACOX1T_06790 [Saccharofermentanales bacterium]
MTAAEATVKQGGVIIMLAKSKRRSWRRRLLQPDG